MKKDYITPSMKSSKKCNMRPPFLNTNDEWPLLERKRSRGSRNTFDTSPLARGSNAASTTATIGVINVLRTFTVGNSSPITHTCNWEQITLQQLYTVRNASRLNTIYQQHMASCCRNVSWFQLDADPRFSLYVENHIPGLWKDFQRPLK